jgi:hypothetical protein
MLVILEIYPHAPPQEVLGVLNPRSLSALTWVISSDPRVEVAVKLYALTMEAKIKSQARVERIDQEPFVRVCVCVCVCVRARAHARACVCIYYTIYNTITGKVARVVDGGQDQEPGTC